MQKFRHLSFIASILIVLCYLTFAILAYVQFPLPYSPIKNWLSDLGNVELNPHGAILYNIGIISTAVLLVLFFLGLLVWIMQKNKIQNIMLFLTLGFGILGSICMILSAVFPINYYKTHAFWSTSLYVMLSTAFIFSVAAFRYHQKFPRWLLVLGLLTAVSVILSIFMMNVYVLEWITVLLFLAYVCLVGVETKRQFHTESR